MNEDFDLSKDILSIKCFSSNDKVIGEWRVKEFISNLKEDLNELLINSNKVCGQALLNKKDEGYSEEHIFDNFFKRMQNGNKEIINRLSGDSLIEDAKSVKGVEQ